MHMMTAQLVSALRAGVYIPKREGSVTLRAIDMSTKNFHCSHLLEKNLTWTLVHAKFRLSYYDISMP
jgi:hypothetical protein